MLVPLQHYLKLRQFQIYQSGDIRDYHYEIRQNGRCRQQVIPFALFVFRKKRPVLVVYQDQAEAIWGQVFLRVQTPLGERMELCAAEWDEQVRCALECAEAYIENPESFSTKQDAETKMAEPLDYYPQLQSSQLIESASIGPYRYELHTKCISKHRMYYHHVLFCYAPFTSSPCFAVSSESFKQGMPATLGVFHENGHSNLGTKGDLLDIDSFRTQALDIVHKELLRNKNKEELPEIKGLLVEKGLIGSYRCELYTDCLQIENVHYIHMFALFMGLLKKSEYLFVLEKHKGEAVPQLVLYRGEKRTTLGFDPALLDVKIFRDRVVTLLRLILSEEAQSQNEITPYQAKSLLRVQLFLSLSGLALLMTLGILSLGSFVNSTSWVSDTELVLFSMGSYCLALLYISLALRLINIAWPFILINLFALLSPIYHFMGLPFALFALIVSHQWVVRNMSEFGCTCGWSGLSYSSKMMLQGISKSGLFARHYINE